MRSLIMSALSGAALLGFSAPAMAHPNDGDNAHDFCARSPRQPV
jgi:hypothetical protein